MKRDFEFKNAVEIIKQSDAFIIDDDLVAPVIEEVTRDNGKKVLSLSWGNVVNYQFFYFVEGDPITFDGQTLEMMTATGNLVKIDPLLKLKKWEEY